MHVPTYVLLEVMLYSILRRGKTESLDYGCSTTMAVDSDYFDVSLLVNLLYVSLEANYGLTSLSLPTSLVSISDSAFFYCTALPTVVIPT